MTIILLGESGCGKSSVANELCKNYNYENMESKFIIIQPKYYNLVIELPASSESFNSNLFSLYPNPTSSILNITNSDNLDIKNISVVDVNGRTVKNQAGSLTQINVSDLNAGVYFVTIEAAEGKTTKKFIKQ